MNFPLRVSEHFYFGTQVLTENRLHRPGHGPNQLGTAGGWDRVLDRDLNKDGQGRNRQGEKSDSCYFYKCDQAGGQVGGLFHEPTGKQQQSLTGERWFGVLIRDGKELVHVATGRNELITIGSGQSAFGGPQFHSHDHQPMRLAGRERKVRT